MIRLVRILGLAVVLAVGLWGTASFADDFPSKPINIWLGSGSGGMTDLSTRILADKMEKILGVRVLVENRPGGGGSIAQSAMLNAPHDGYVMTDFSTNHAAAAVLLNTGIKLADLAPLGSYMPQERVLFGSTSAPFSDMEGLIKYAKDKPVTFANAGVWPSKVVQGFAKQKGLQLRVVPFNSGGAASAALLGGHVMIAETGVGTALWSAARGSNKVNMLTTLSNRDKGLASLGFPDVPNLAQFGADNVVNYYYGFTVPADVPPDRIQILSNALKQALADPDVIKRFKSVDLTPEWMAPSDYEALLQKVHASAENLKALLAQ